MNFSDIFIKNIDDRISNLNLNEYDNRYINQLFSKCHQGDNTTFYTIASYLYKDEKHIMEQIYLSNSQIERLRLENKLYFNWLLKSYIIEYLNNTNIESDIIVKLYYPSIDNFNFNTFISENNKFKQYSVPIITPELLSKQPVNNFIRSPTQNFVASYISPDTPYNSLLLWHGVGAGKTCAAIGIAEGILKSDSKKNILVITPSESLHDSWINEIFNFTKEINKLKHNRSLQDSGKEVIENVQCTSNKYNPFMDSINILPNKPSLRNKLLSKLKRLVKKKINETYTFTTYNKIVNIYEKYSRKYHNVLSSEGKLVNYIVKQYSNKVIIMDEIHRVRETSDSKSDDNIDITVADTNNSLLKIKSSIYILLDNGKWERGIVYSIDHGTTENDILYSIKLFKSRKVYNNVPRSRIWTKRNSMKEQKIMLLKMISRYAINTKIILLTATPMYNDSDEIIDLLDILLLNDGKPSINKNEIFQSDNLSLVKNSTEDHLNTNAIKKLINCSRGYISYIRGENPIVFPIKLYPYKQLLNNDKILNNIYQDLSVLGYLPKPILRFDNTEHKSKESLTKELLDPELYITSPPLYKNIFSDYQLACWIFSSRYLVKYPIKKRNTKNITEGLVDRISETDKLVPNWSYPVLLEGKPPTHISITTFPTLNQQDIDNILNDNVDYKLLYKFNNCFGKIGFDKTFLKDGNKYIINPKLDQNYLKLINNDEMQGIRKYSCKIANILRLINTCKGIVFIYSEFVVDSIDVIALALEANGYCQYNNDDNWDNNKKEWSGKNNDLLHGRYKPSYNEKRNYQGKCFSELSSNDNFKQGRYIILKGDVSLAVTNNLLDVVTRHQNINGQNIKIILGSKKVKEGFSLKGVRQIHILDPWYHLNSIDQSTGRGIRSYSHSLLEKPDRNVSVFLHTAGLDFFRENNNNKKYIQYFRDILPDNFKEQTLKNLVKDWTSQPTIIKPSEDIFNDNLCNLPILFESSDEQLYRNAYNKSKLIAKVARILKQNAVDCKLNLNGNIFSQNKLTIDGIKPITITTSQNKIIDDFRMGYQDYSWECDFDLCTYNCYLDGSDASDTDSLIEGQQLQNDLYIHSIPIHDSIFNKIKQIIEKMFKTQFIFRLDEITNKVIEIYPEITINKIYTVLAELVSTNSTIYDMFNRPSYIIYRNNEIIENGYYILQPIYYNNNLNESTTDQTISLSLRKIIPPIYNNYIKITDTNNPIQNLYESIDSIQSTSQITSKTDNISELPSDEIDTSGNNLDVYNNIREYYKILLSYVVEQFYCSYPNDIRTNTMFYRIQTPFKFTSILDKSDKIIVPTILNLIVMSGFCILDSLDNKSTLLLINRLCKDIIKYQISIIGKTELEKKINKEQYCVSNFIDCKKYIKTDILFKGENKSRKRNEINNVNSLFQVCPSFFLICCLYFFGSTPDEINNLDSDYTIGVNVKVFTKGTVLEYNDKIIDIIDKDDDTKLYRLEKDKKVVSKNEIIPLTSNKYKISFTETDINYIYNGKNRTATLNIPKYFRLVDPSYKTIQNIYSIEYTNIDIDNDLVNIKNTLVELGDSLEKNPVELSLDYLHKNPNYDSRIYGYTDLITKKVPSLSGYTSNIKLNNITTIILDQFYYKNRLDLDIASQKAVTGCLARQAIKLKKTQIINSILCSSNRNPYTPLFYRYPLTKHSQDIKYNISNIILLPEHEKKNIMNLESISLEKDGLITDVNPRYNVTFELLLLLQFCQFYRKGGSLLTWILHKDSSIIKNNIKK